jgi:hypothetical protein
MMNENKGTVSELPMEAKIAIAIRLAEVIDDCKDQEVLRGLRSLFHALIGDLVNPEVRH